MTNSSSSAPPAHLCLVRHAQTDWNANGRWQGHADPPLSAEGRGQAAALALALQSDLAGAEVGRLVCSDLGRTRETAGALGEMLGLEAVLEPGLREIDIGDWSGLERSQIEKRDPDLLALFEAGDPDARPPGGETRREIRHRVRLVVRRIVDTAPEGRIVVVTHLGVIRALLPGAEPANADFTWVSAADALTRRMRVEHPEGESPGPL